jgi:hypothetical protein
MGGGRGKMDSRLRGNDGLCDDAASIVGFIGPTYQREAGMSG